MTWRFDGVDRRAGVVGVVFLAVLAVVYPLVADATARPLAVFVLPCLLTAVLGGWRPTTLVGVASLAVAVVYGVMGPLDAGALVARWVIIGVGVVAGAVGAAVRERQRGRLAELDEALLLREGFERALAPVPIPPPGFDAVARYRPAESRMQLGGDFLEAIGLADGRLAVLIGDVCGHGPREAALGATLRAGWKTIALSAKREPEDWVEALNTSFFLDGRIDTYATLCTGYLDLPAGVARLVNAGHPHPVLIGPPPRSVPLPSSPPLGMGLGEYWPATEVAWRGDPLLFFTDGLVENPRVRGRPERWGTNGLLKSLDALPPSTSIATSADRLLSAATAEREVRDDIAFLIVAASTMSRTADRLRS